jgi:hypothetical protein
MSNQSFFFNHVTIIFIKWEITSCVRRDSNMQTWFMTLNYSIYRSITTANYMQVSTYWTLYDIHTNMKNNSFIYVVHSAA